MIVGIEVSSFAGSCLQVYRDFCIAVLDTWAQGLEEAYERRGDELRAGRQAYKALLDRYEREGYTPDMGPELTRLSATYCSKSYQARFIAALPNDLETVLDMCFSDEEDEEEGAPLSEAAIAHQDRGRVLRARGHEVEELMHLAGGQAQIADLFNDEQARCQIAAALLPPAGGLQFVG